MRVLFVFLLLIWTATIPVSAKEVYEFTDTEHRKVFEQSLPQINCPGCAGQSIAGSSSAMAEGLRQLVFELATDGYSVAEIKEYLRAGYGEEVLRQPSSLKHNAVLIGMPLLFVLLALCGLWFGVFAGYHKHRRTKIFGFSKMTRTSFGNSGKKTKISRHSH